MHTQGTGYARADWDDVVMAGHSLGEWSALVAAGALTLRDAARLVVRFRGCCECAVSVLCVHACVRVCVCVCVCLSVCRACCGGADAARRRTARGMVL